MIKLFQETEYLSLESFLSRNLDHPQGWVYKKLIELVYFDFLSAISFGACLTYVMCRIVCKRFLTVNWCYFQKNARDKVNVGIRAPYFRVLGIDMDGSGQTSSNQLTPAEEEEFIQLAAHPNLYETIAKSIAPSIWGSVDVKKAIACLLFGGSRKRYGIAFYLFLPFFPYN